MVIKNMSEVHDSGATPVGDCDKCGAEVELYSHTNVCPNCETEYNQSGQMLAPHEQWGSETGETYSDIIN